MALAETNIFAREGSQIPEYIEDGFSDIPEVAEDPEDDPYIVKNIPLAYINTLNQHRNGPNKVQHQLTASLSGKAKMMNAINVTAMDENTLDTYISFTNRVWRADQDIADFVPYGSGKYIIAIAGHSRLISHHEIAARKGIPLEDYGVKSRIHMVDTLDDYIGLQVAENIHAAPSPDRAARAYAEVYSWQKETSVTPLTKKEFASEHGITTDFLTQALNYASLPAEIRQLTDCGQLPFSITVELGKGMKWLILDAEVRMSEGRVDDAEKELGVNGVVLRDLYWLATMYNDRFKGHITNTNVFIKHHIKALQAKFIEQEEMAEMEMQLFDGREYDNPNDKLRRHAAIAMQELYQERVVAQRNLHNALSDHLGVDGVSIDPDIESDLLRIGRAVTNISIFQSI